MNMKIEKQNTNKYEPEDGECHFVLKKILFAYELSLINNFKQLIKINLYCCVCSAPPLTPRHAKSTHQWEIE